MAKFKIGEKARVVLGPVAEGDDPAAYSVDGQEVIVAGIGCPDGYRQIDGEQSYEIQVNNGLAYVVAESVLRKLAPESDDIRETREKGAPSFSKMMEGLKQREEVE